jgi:hypothetical protein
VKSFGVGAGLFLLCALACGKKSATTPPDPSAVAPVAPSRVPELKREAPPVEVEAPNSCVALVVNGSVKSGSLQLVPQARLDTSGFIDLGAAARIVVKHTKSGRELTLEGPARAELCRGGEEQVLLASGRFKSTTGVGARPGAEVWVATPAGLIRYGDAELDVKADGKRVTLSVVSGDAWVEPAHGSTLKGASHVVPKNTASLSRGGASTTASLVSHCEESADAAASAAQRVLGGLDGGADAGSLGERAAAQVHARRAARAACASAGAAVGQVKDQEEHERLAARIDRANRLWRLVPPRKSSGNPGTHP